LSNQSLLELRCEDIGEHYGRYRLAFGQNIHAARL
jgi:hypothetical protein